MWSKMSLTERYGKKACATCSTLKTKGKTILFPYLLTGGVPKRSTGGDFYG